MPNEPTMSSGKISRPKRASKRSSSSAQTGGSGAAGKNRDFEELFACLSAARVKVLIVGGYAVAFHAKPRYTKDLDLLIEPTVENARRLLEALERLGSGTLGLTVEDFTKPTSIVQLGVPPNRIDFLTSIAGVDFDDAWRGLAGLLAMHRPARADRAEVVALNRRGAALRGAGQELPLAMSARSRAR
jgi:hypothetical protein